MKRIFTIALVAATLAVSALGAEDLYLVTLRAEAAVDRLATVAEQFAMSYGGTVVEVDAVGGTMLMRLPAARVATAGRDPRVQSIRPAGGPRVGTDAAEVVLWGTGVTYAYDGAGNVTKIQNDEFTYDVASRLVSSKINGQTRTYEYDAYGNRTKCMEASTDCQGHTIVASNNRISGINYDAAGNVTSLDGHQVSYDALNMQIRDVDTTNGVTRDYVYTADDERIAIYTVNQWWRWTIRDTSGKVLREYMSEGQQGTQNWQWVKDSVWRGGVLLATRHVPPGGATAVTYRYHLDHLGTPRRITDDGDHIVGFHDYFAFGPETTNGKNEPSLTLFKYTGHERDRVDSSTAAPLDYMHARYCSSTIGRFLSVDPIPGRQREPQSWNRYTYALNNPLKYTDPDGRYVTNCAAEDTQCNADAATFEAARQTDLQSKDAAVAAAASAYGNPDVANGITVGFGTTGKDGGTTTAQLRGNADGTMGMTATVMIKSGLSGTELNAAVAHEGQHVLDAQGFVNTFTKNGAFWDISKNPTSFQTEMNAYRLTHSVFAAAHQTFSTGCTGCKLGGTRPLTPADRDLAIRRILADPSGAYKVTPQNQGPRQFPAWMTPP